MTERKFLYLDDAHFGPAESDSSSDTITLAGMSLSGDLAMSGGAKVTGLAAPTAGGDAVNKTYADNLISGLQWREPADLLGLVGNLGFAAINALTPGDGDAYVLTDAGTLTTGSLAVVAGDMVQYNGTAWIKVVAASGGFPPDGTRAVLSTSTALVSPYTDATDDGKIVEFDGTSLTGVDTGEATDGSAILINGEGAYDENAAFVFDGAVPTGTWVQFSGAGQIVAGAGLTKDGNTLNVGAGDGIAVAADSVAVDLAANPGLEFSGGDLLVKVAGDKGIVLTANGVEIEIDDTPDTLDVDADGLKVVGVPSLFKVNDTAVGATVTAPNFDTLTDGSNADSLHSHAAIPADEAKRIEDTHTNDVIVAAKQVVRWTANDEITPAANDTAVNSRAIGVARTGGAADATSEIVKVGVCAGALVGATVNTPYFLGAAGALVLMAAVPKPGRMIRIGYAKNATDLDVQIADYGYRRA